MYSKLSMDLRVDIFVLFRIPTFSYFHFNFKNILMCLISVYKQINKPPRQLAVLDSTNINDCLTCLIVFWE